MDLSEPTTPYRSIPPFGQWAEWIVFWRRRIRDNPELANELVRFYQLAFEWLPEPAYSKAWFGAHSNCISLTLGNMWLACIGSWRGGEIELLVDDPALWREPGVPLPSMERYVPLGLAVWPWQRVGYVNLKQSLWRSYARAAEKIWAAPISRNEISIVIQNKRRLPDLLGKTTPLPIGEAILTPPPSGEAGRGQEQ